MLECQIVHGVRRYRCDICGLQCIDLFSRLIIVFIRVPCSLCGRGIMRGYDLKVHVNNCMRAKENEQFCTGCPKIQMWKCCLQWRNKSGLETCHVHTREEPYHCLLCGGGFARGYDLKLHVNRCRKKNTRGLAHEILVYLLIPFWTNGISHEVWSS